MRVRTYIDFTTRFNPLKRFIAWILVGISASQLGKPPASSCLSPHPFTFSASDISILENKIRLKKPLVVPFDGPYNRTNAWLKQFYSQKSLAVGETQGAYQNDW